jgi:shikimate dehydrogenase
MKRAAVIGSPIAHSLSPSIFSFLARALGEQLRYEKTQIAPPALADFFSNLRQECASTEWLGVNVTLPHKEAVLKLADRLSPAARLVGAANVIVVDRSQTSPTLHAHNTDVEGILETLHEQRLEAAGTHALIIGAGGAARAAAFALGSQGAKLVAIVNPRSPERAKGLAADFGSIFPGCGFSAAPSFGAFQLVLQCTPVGQAGVDHQEDGFYSFLEPISFESGALAFDLIYRPEQTPFLEWARRRGLRSVGGLDMLIAQALATWELWRGPHPARNELRSALKKHLKKLLAENRPVLLTGFMGAGKTTVGQALAERLGWPFLDIDWEIEREASLSITEIFSRKGEAFFRALESQIIRRALQTQKNVIALGGGSLLNPGLLEDVLGQGQLIYLAADMETLQARLRADPAFATRPLLAETSQNGLREKMTSLFESRLPAYDRAPLKIEVGNEMSVAEVVERILGVLHHDET